MNCSSRLAGLLAVSLAVTVLGVPPAACAADVEVRTIASQPSWVIRTGEVELAVTQLGGHMAPVVFDRRSREPIEPYYVSPWQGEGLKLDAPVLRPLRGDFFCMPFGANAEPVAGVQFPGHGETASSSWSLVGCTTSGPATTLTLRLEPRLRPGKVAKRLSLVEGQNVVYVEHVLEGFSGRMPLGHHPTLAVPEQEGSLRVASSPFVFGMTSPVLFSNPADREYQSFAIAARFADLRRVPLVWKEPAEADCTRLPARTGFTDLLAIFKRPSGDGTPAWMAVTNRRAGYLWFSLKDPAVLPSTVFWIANRGRHGPPWNARNRCLGLEDVCAYFDRGIAASIAPNGLSEAGIATAIDLSPERAATIRHIQGVVRVPAGFETVRTVEFAPGRVTFVSPTGMKAGADVKWSFLRHGKLE